MVKSRSVLGRVFFKNDLITDNKLFWNCRLWPAVFAFIACLQHVFMLSRLSPICCEYNRIVRKEVNLKRGQREKVLKGIIYKEVLRCPNIIHFTMEGAIYH